MNIGRFRRTIEVEPSTVPVPEVLPIPEPTHSEPAPAEEPTLVPNAEPASEPAREPVPAEPFP